MTSVKYLLNKCWDIFVKSKIKKEIKENEELLNLGVSASLLSFKSKILYFFLIIN